MRLSILIPAVSTALLLSACGGSKEDNQVTETRMDDLDSLEGTISDDIMNSDESTDEAPTEAAPAAVPSKAPVEAADAEPELEKRQNIETGGPEIVKIDPASETQ